MSVNRSDMAALGFRFDVGAVVAHRGQVRIRAAFPPDREGSPWQKRPLPQALVIVSRIAEECAGGVQLLYGVRHVSEEGFTTAPVSVHECELEPYATAPAPAAEKA
jgi:hypothetical protein